jgi:hypothetical protein
LITFFVESDLKGSIPGPVKEMIAMRQLMQVVLIAWEYASMMFILIIIGPTFRLRASETCCGKEKA